MLMRRPIHSVFLLCAALAVAVLPRTLPAAPAAPGGPLRVAAVQFRIDPQALRSFAAYRERIGALVQRAVEGAPGFRPQLVVFPEYSGAFTALIPYGDVLARAETVEQALAEIRRGEPLVRTLHDLLALNSGVAGRAVEEIFGGLARRYGVAIVAGSHFAWSQEGGGRLVNRAQVFGPDGRRLYSQDKVFLTEFESDAVGVEPGSLADARPFRVDGRLVGLTLCRDTFFPEWERVLGGTDLWIDIKANGTAFTEEERKRFLRALPARLRSVPVPYGLTVCLTGKVLDLLWEGRTSLAAWQGGEVRYRQQAARADDQEILYLSLP